MIRKKRVWFQTPINKILISRKNLKVIGRNDLKNQSSTFKSCSRRLFPATQSSSKYHILPSRPSTAKNPKNGSPKSAKQKLKQMKRLLIKTRKQKMGTKQRMNPQVGPVVRRSGVQIIESVQLAHILISRTHY